MIRDRDNFLVNRAGLIHGIRNLGECLNEALMEEVFDVLAPIARGEILEPEHSQPAAAADAAEVNLRRNVVLAAGMLGPAVVVAALLPGPIAAGVAAIVGLAGRVALAVVMAGLAKD
jgi:hypothetical protein